MHYRIMRIMVILFIISVVPITLGWRAAPKNPQFGIPEFGINMSSIIKKTHSVISQQQHNIAVIKNNFVSDCLKGLSRGTKLCLRLSSIVPYISRCFVRLVV